MSANGTPTYFNFNPLADRQVTGTPMIGLGPIAKDEVRNSLLTHIQAHQNGAGPVSLTQTAREFIATASANPAKMPVAGTPVFGLNVTPAILASCALLELWASRTRIPAFRAKAADVLTQPAQQARLAAIEAYEASFAAEWQPRPLPDLKGKKEVTGRGTQLVPDVEEWTGLPWHIIHMSGLRSLLFGERLQRMMLWLSNGTYPQQPEDRTQALWTWGRALKDILGSDEASRNLFAIYAIGQGATEAPFLADYPLPPVAYVRSTWHLATQLAHRIAPVAVVHSPKGRKEYDEYSVLVWGDDSTPFINLDGLKVDLQTADKGGSWGGGPTAVNNLQPSKLDADTITQMVLARTIYILVEQIVIV
jgi:hypothetical protein